MGSGSADPLGLVAVALAVGDGSGVGVAVGDADVEAVGATLGPGEPGDVEGGGASEGPDEDVGDATTDGAGVTGAGEGDSAGDDAVVVGPSVTDADAEGTALGVDGLLEGAVGSAAVGPGGPAHAPNTQIGRSRAARRERRYTAMILEGAVGEQSTPPNLDDRPPGGPDQRRGSSVGLQSTRLPGCFSVRLGATGHAAELARRIVSSHDTQLVV